MVFIDETGRVYANWEHFMTENTYDPSIIVAPTKGIFNTDDQGKVCLEFFTAPSSSVGAKLLSITDKTATVTGLGASACFIGGMLTVALLPVAAPAIGIAMAGAGLVGAASAGYSVMRSTQKVRATVKFIATTCNAPLARIPCRSKTSVNTKSRSVSRTQRRVATG